MIPMREHIREIICTEAPDTAVEDIIALLRERLTSNEMVGRIAESLHPMLHDSDASPITTNRRCIRAANTAITAALDAVLGEGAREAHR